MGKVLGFLQLWHYFFHAGISVCLSPLWQNLSLVLSLSSFRHCDLGPHKVKSFVSGICFPPSMALFSVTHSSLALLGGFQELGGKQSSKPQVNPLDLFFQ